MSLTQIIVYVLIAAIIGLIAERLVGAGPWGLIGNIIVGLLGIFVMLHLLKWTIPGDPQIEGIPILTAILGAIIVDLILSFLIRRSGPRRSWRRGI